MRKRVRVRIYNRFMWGDSAIFLAHYYGVSMTEVEDILREGRFQGW